MKTEQPDNDQINEPLEEYFQSPKFLAAFKKITISTPEEQEEANRIFSASLTPLQRIEYLYYLNKKFLAEYIEKVPSRFTRKIYFD